MIKFYVYLFELYNFDVSCLHLTMFEKFFFFATPISSGHYYVKSFQRWGKHISKGGLQVCLQYMVCFNGKLQRQTPMPASANPLKNLQPHRCPIAKHVTAAKLINKSCSWPTLSIMNVAFVQAAHGGSLGVGGRLRKKSKRKRNKKSGLGRPREGRLSWLREKFGTAPCMVWGEIILVRVQNGPGSHFDMLEAFTEIVILVAASKNKKSGLVLADTASQIHISHPTWYHITSATGEVNQTS